MRSYVTRTEPITIEEYAAELQTWKGSPYLAHGFRRCGVDCLRFLVLMQDWCHGWSTEMLPPIPTPSNQIAINAPRQAFKIIKWMQNRYPSERTWGRKDDRATLQVLPGDTVIVRNQIHPGHGLIGGPRRNTCWHAFREASLPMGGDVHETSVGWCLGEGLLQVWHMKESLLVRS